MTSSNTYQITIHSFLIFLCLGISSVLYSQCNSISSIGYSVNENHFCEFPAIVNFNSTAELDSTHQHIANNVSPNNFQQAFNFNYSTLNNGCYYYLKMSGSVTLWGNMNHFDGYAKFNANTNVMYAPPGLNNYLSPIPDISPAAYDTTHVYDFFYEGDGNPVTFSFNDFPLWDNFGSVSFDWYAIPCFHYHWDFGDGQTSIEKSPSHIYSEPGIYAATLTITDSLALCSTSYTDTIKVFQGPTVMASGIETHYCITDTVSILTGSPNDGSFMGNGVSGDQFNPSLAGVGGPLEVIYQYTDQNGCSSSDTMITEVFDNPQVSLLGLKPEYCANDVSEILNGVPDGGNIQGMGIVGNQFEPFNVPSEFLIEITYVYMDLNGCSSESTAQTIVHDVPHPNLGPDTSFCFPGSLVLYPGAYSAYDWGHSSNAVTYASSQGSYEVRVTDFNGCSNSDTLYISNHCISPIYIPNSFTPDGDGVNDIFIPVIDMQFIEDYSFFIADRWGEEVFRTNNFYEGWDGSYGTTYVPAGTYVWKLTITGTDGEGIKSFSKTGSVNVLR